ncbi:Glycine/D-amino acid oxidase [Halopseudomonas sabulinigri]|uniref:Glycine/D-amino acid oxidase n=1 Tax=Halopseudomonas sabulinigri TaxID=472181 RepID=A0A1H1LF98_9GAMM|nr:FAD-dependent oxidoreductase [Halopseudomonas sabulinigri]SDR72990.1 Glycine/D-amino acid oxidase [Halopseudomonas sabulinigri]
MDLRSGHCFWPINSGLIQPYPSLAGDLDCDVLVIGAGITGALIADYLTQKKAKVVVLDRRDVVSGSTSASTAMLQYEIDTHLSDLITRIGKDPAERAYHLCSDAIDKLAKITKDLPDCGFERYSSFYFASSEDDVSALEREYEARKQAGFDIELWRTKDITSRFNFSAPCGLYSKQGAQVDPFRLAHALLARASKAGAQIFDRTEVSDIDQVQDGIVAYTAEGHQVRAQKVVFACGYEAQSWLQEKVVDLNSTFALVTEPVDSFEGWYEQCLLWESERPYTYMRTTSDNRILIGGEDEPYKNSELRDKALPKKTKALSKKLSALMPSIPFQVAYSWAGTFGETEDGLAYIGETREFPNAYFALGYGGNGITYSVTAAQIIADLYLGKSNADADLFRFGR